MAEQGVEPTGAAMGSYESVSTLDPYVAHLLSYVDASSLQDLSVVCNAGNGGAGRVIDALEPHLPLRFTKVHHEADGHFPNGVPNPLLEENREATAGVVRTAGADLGIAWDGDFDRCFFFTAEGEFVEGYYIVGLLADAFLAQQGPQRVVHDPRLTWNTQAIVEAAGGEAVASKTGHAFIKERMREVDAIYGGEMSAHHYFRDFAYCDSGMIPWLLVTELMSRRGESLASLVAAREAAFPCSGEINRRIEDPKALIEAVEAHYGPGAEQVAHLDGLSVEMADWRFNLRMSNTEPVVRLNVESRGNKALMEARTEELLAFMER